VDTTMNGVMDMDTVTIQLPAHLYTELETLARAVESDPITLLGSLIREARQERSLRRTWDELCDLVQRDGGLKIGNTTEEIVEQMRKTRHELFEAEYAHLYR